MEPRISTRLAVTVQRYRHDVSAFLMKFDPVRHEKLLSKSLFPPVIEYSSASGSDRYRRDSE